MTAVSESAGLLSPRQLGRPRDPKLDGALIDATLELLADDGYTALTMEAVAARAGVGKATLYRRWPNKEALVVEAVATLSEPPEISHGSGVRAELVTLVEAIRHRTGSSLAIKIFPRLIGEGAANPEFMRRYQKQVLDPRRERFRACLARGVEQGLIRHDLDLDYAVGLFVGPMVYRNLIRNDPPPGPDLAARIVDDVLAGLAPRPVQSQDCPTSQEKS